MHAELDACIGRSGRSSDFLLLLFGELRHFPIEKSSFRLKFLELCESIRNDIEDERKRARSDAEQWTVQRIRTRRKSFDYAESVEGADEDEDDDDAGVEIRDSALEITGQSLFSEHERRIAASIRKKMTPVLGSGA